MIAVTSQLAAALDAPANEPVDLYELQLDSGTKYWSTEAITWNGQAYEAMVIGRSACVQNMSGEFNTVSVRVANVSTAAAQALLGESIEGRRLTIRKIDRTVTNDSVVIFSGILQRISSIDLDEAVVEAIELLGSIDDQFGRPFQSSCSIREFKGAICRYAGPETTCDRSWAQCSGYGNTESFFGMRFLEHQGAFQYFETQVKRFLLFFKRKKKERKTASWTGVDDTPRGAAVPQVWGRTQVAAIPLYHEDQGGVVKGLSVFCGGPVDQIGYYRANEALVPSVTEHQGQLGGLGNQTIDPRIANLYEMSGLAYITYDVPSAVEEVDPAPLITGLVKGRLVRHYNTSGVFTGLSWSDNPALIAHDFMVLELDHGGMGLSESDVNLTSLGQTAAICDASVPDTTGDTKIFQPSTLPAGQSVGVEYRRYQPTGVIGHDPMADGPYAAYTPGVDDDTQTPSAVNVKRFTCNVVATEREPKVDILFDKIFPTFRGFRRYDKNGKIEILSEGANPFSTISGALGAGSTAVPVASTAGFAAGKYVILGPHTANAECIAIQSVGAGVLNLDAPTQQSHANGDEALQVDMRLDDSRLMGKIQYPLSGREPSYNQVVVKYLDAPGGFEEIPLEVNDYADQLTRRKVNSKAIDVLGVDNFFQAWRLGQTELAKSRDYAKWAQVQGDISLSLLEVGDVVSLSSGEHGLAAVPFRVEQKADEEDHSVSLLLRIYASGLYDDVAPRTTLNVPSVFAPILPGEVGLPNAPGPVTALTLTSIVQDPEDPMLVRIEASYTPPSPLADFDGVEVHVEVPSVIETDPVSYAGPGLILPQGWNAWNGSDLSKLIARLPFPAKQNERWHVYAVSRSKFVTAPLVHRAQPSATPSIPVDVPQNPQGFEAPNVTGVTITRDALPVVLRSRTAAKNPKVVEYLKASWTLPTGAANYRELVYLVVELVRNATSEVESRAVLVVSHGGGQPTSHLVHNLPTPDPPEAYYVRVKAVNREGRESGSPPQSSLITLGEVAAAPGVTAATVTPEYRLNGEKPEYRFYFTWTLPTADPNYEEAFDRVDIEGRPTTDANWTLFSREGEGATSQRTSYWARPTANQLWNFRFVPVNVGGERNLAAAFNVSNVNVTALSESAQVTLFTPTVTSGVNEAGVQLYGYSGTWSNPADANFAGVIIEGTIVGETVPIIFAIEREGATAFKTDLWPRPETTFQIDMRAISINHEDKRTGSSPVVRLTVTPGTGGLKLSRADVATVGQGLGVSGGQLKVPDGAIVNNLIGTVAAEKLIGALISGLEFQLISGDQQMYINGTDGFRQYDGNASALREVKLKFGMIEMLRAAVRMAYLSVDSIGVNHGGKLELHRNGQARVTAGAGPTVDAGFVQVNGADGSSGFASMSCGLSNLGQANSGYLQIVSSGGVNRVVAGVDANDKGQVRFDNDDYAVRADAAGTKVVAGVGQFVSGSLTINSGLSSIVSAVATPVSGGTPTNFIGTGTPSGSPPNMSVTFYDSIGGSSSFFNYVIVGTI